MGLYTLISEAKNTNTRAAVVATIIFCFELLQDGKKTTFSQEQIEEAAYLMHDDNIFLKKLINFINEYIEDCGENYGLD